MPFDIPKVFVAMQSSKMTVMYSNMSGPKEPYDWNGSKCNWFCAILPPFGSNHCSVMAMSQGDSLQICVGSDTNSIDQPDLWMSLLDKNVSEFLGNQKVTLQTESTGKNSQTAKM